MTPKTLILAAALSAAASFALAENHEATGTDGATTGTDSATTGTEATTTEATAGEGATSGGMAAAGDATEMGRTLAEPNTEAMAAATASEGYMQVMMSAMEKMTSRPMTGDAEIDYITMMIPHHQSAVDNSRIVLANTDDPEIQEFAQKVIDAQEAEIAELQEMLAARMGADGQ